MSGRTFAVEKPGNPLPPMVFGVLASTFATPAPMLAPRLLPRIKRLAPEFPAMPWMVLKVRMFPAEGSAIKVITPGPLPLFNWLSDS